MTPNCIVWPLALIAGFLAGTVYFAGLWWTVRHLEAIRRPSLLIPAGYIVRTALVLGVFYVVGRDHWARLLICLAGFMVARAAITRTVRPLPPRKEEHPAADISTTPGTTDG